MCVCDVCVTHHFTNELHEPLLFMIGKPLARLTHTETMALDFEPTIGAYLSETNSSPRENSSMKSHDYMYVEENGGTNGGRVGEKE